MILYTSGTTGHPKGVLHSHNSIHALICQLRDHWLIEPGDKFLVPSPIAHIGGSIYAFECPLLLGTTAVLMDRWDPTEAVRVMSAEGCTHMASATPFLEDSCGGRTRRYPPARPEGVHLRWCIGAAIIDPLGGSLFERAVVTRVYGSTEVPVTTIGSPTDPEHAADTDGRAGIADIKLVAHDTAPPGSARFTRADPRCWSGTEIPTTCATFRRRRLLPHRRPRDVGG